MNLNIGIVEDDNYYADQLTGLIQEWQRQTYCQVSLCICHSCQEFLQKIDQPFDLIFFDIELKDGNGVDLAKQLRENGYKGHLLFLTSFREYVFEGYNVHALNYLLKPVDYETVKNCLDTVFSTVYDENYIYRFRDTIIKLPYHSIIYFSSSNHQTEIYTEEGNYIQTEPLRNIIQHLPEHFVQCHRAVIINMQHVMQISGKNVILSNDITIPVSLTYIDQIRAAFVKQIQEIKK